MAAASGGDPRNPAAADGRDLLNCASGAAGVKYPEHAKYFVGTAGWSYDDWEGIVYPAAKARGFHALSYLPAFIEIVEVNSTFYRPAPPAMVRSWLKKLDGRPGFLLSLKLFQAFTHAREEMVATCILLLFAGHETTTNHIANSLLALLQFPDEMAKLRADAALAPAAVEELLRYDGPTNAQVRIVQREHELHGKRLRAGERVFILLSAANRDPRAYADPDRVDLERNGPPHLSFGFGPHLCPGFPLSRLEGQIALPAVLARLPRLELAGASLEWLNSMVFRGLKSLPVRVRH